MFGAGWWSRPKSLEALEKRSCISCRSDSVWATSAQSSAKRTSWRRTLQALCFGSETTQIEEGAVQTIANVDTFLQAMDSVGEHAGEEDVGEDRGSVADCEGFRHIPVRVNLPSYAIVEEPGHRYELRRTSHAL